MFQQIQTGAADRSKLLIYLILPLAYVVCGRLGLFLAVPPGYATAVFLPAGIAIGGMPLQALELCREHLSAPSCSTFGLVIQSHTGSMQLVLLQH